MVRDRVQTFVLCRDPETRVWVLRHANGRVFARSQYKDTTLELARQIARRRAPSVVSVYNGEGRRVNMMKYQTPVLS